MHYPTVQMCCYVLVEFHVFLMYFRRGTHYIDRYGGTLGSMCGARMDLLGLTRSIYMSCSEDTCSNVCEERDLAIYVCFCMICTLLLPRP